MLQKGFLAGRVVSDRRSVAYLEQKVDGLENALHFAKDGWSEAKRRGDATLQQLKGAAEREASLHGTIGDLTRQASRHASSLHDLAGELAAEKDKARKLSRSLSDAHETIEAQQKEIRTAHWILWGILVLMLILCAFLLYQRFAPLHDDVAAQATPPSMVEQAVPAPGSGKAKKASKPVVPGR